MLGELFRKIRKIAVAALQRFKDASGALAHIRSMSFGLAFAHCPADEPIPRNYAAHGVRGASTEGDPEKPIATRTVAVWP